jgi:hypothetical protein
MLILTMVILAGCATTPAQPAQPVRLGLKLAPTALGESIAVQQHLKVERNGRTDELDVALEIDAEHLELVGLAFGQRVLSVHYDGDILTSWRHVMLPAQVRAEDVLEDLQLTLWPLEAIRAALPAGWHMEQQGLRRTLMMGNTVIMTINYSTTTPWSGITTLENIRYKYRLTIQSAATSP